MLDHGKKGIHQDRRVCQNCIHYCMDIDPHSGWGFCDVAKDSGMFMNHTKYGKYLAKHTNGRYYTQKACRIRFANAYEVLL